MKKYQNRPDVPQLGAFLTYPMRLSWSPRTGTQSHYRDVFGKSGRAGISVLRESYQVTSLKILPPELQSFRT